MKTKLLFAVILVISVSAFIFYAPPAKVNSPTLSTAGNGPFDNTYFISALDFGGTGTTNQYHDSLYLSLWHQYPSYGERLQSGWVNRAPGDTLTADISDYGSQIQGILTANQNDGMNTLMHRVKIDYLAMGQRSDYQCEDASNVNDDYDFYTYYKHDGSVSTEYQDNSSYGNGIYVRYSRIENSTNQGPWVHSAGYVVDSLKANREQINYTAYSSSFMADQLYPWYIKPRIRVDSAYANNPANFGTLVCRIDVLNFNGDTIKRADIKVRNFKEDQVTRYEGNYIEEFYFTPYLPQDTSILYIEPIADPSNPENPRYNTNLFNPDRESIWNFDCAVDFRVYWYGNCDMWIDYVRVENQIANELFSGTRDPWIDWEVQLASYNNSPAEFYVEEFEFNMVPCMSYVAKKIRQYSDDKFNLMCVLNWGEYIIHQPDPVNHQFDLDYLKRNLIDTLQLREFCDFAYPFMGYRVGVSGFETPVYVPNTLPISANCPDSGRLSLPAAPADYDEWLQVYLDENSSWGNDNFIKWMKHGDEISKQFEIPFVNLPQTHLWYNPAYIHREPTNEEIQMMLNVSVTYGARAQLYFWYGNWGTIGSNDYGRGMTGGYPYQNPYPRTSSVYGQNKWTAIKDINRTLNTWGPTLMSFTNDDRQSYIYRLERTDLINETYFRDIVTYKPGSGDPQCLNDDPGGSSPPGMVYECYEERYVQAAVFKQDGSNTPYFMIVNRRCSPISTGSPDGKRYIRIAFDANSPSFPTYRYWKILDIADEDWGVEFNKTTGSLIDLGEFNPSEGRLYKIVPVY